MFKSFEVNDYKDNSLLNYCLREIISMKFLRYSKEEKMNALSRLDGCVSDLCGLPYFNFTSNYSAGVALDEMYISDIDNFNFGLNLINYYFYNKRQQYQKHCVLSGEKGDFKEVEFEALKFNYEHTPITNKRLFVKSRKFRNHLFNYNVLDAHLYAGEQMVSVLNCVDYIADFDSYSLIDRLKFLFFMKNAINNQKRTAEKMTYFTENSKWQGEFFDILEDYEEKLLNENSFMENISEKLDGSYDKSDEISLCCFNENIWQSLSKEEKMMVVENSNQLLSSAFGFFKKFVSYDAYRLIEINDCVCSVGDVESITGMQALRAIVYSYAYSGCLNKLSNSKNDKIVKFVNHIENNRKYYDVNDFANIDDKSFIKDISKLAVDMQKYVYLYVKSDDYLRSTKINFYNNEKSFVYNLYSDVNVRRGGR